MSKPIKRVLMRDAASAMHGADPKKWHYGPTFGENEAASQHARFAEMVAASGAEIEWLPAERDGLADSVFTHDPSLVTDKGAVILRMGKPLRVPEPALHEALYERLGVPVIGRIEAPGTVEGGDCIFVDEKTLAIGRGSRTNEAGIAQLRDILAPQGIEVLGFDLPYGQGEEACLHLMSVASPLAPDLMLVYAPLLRYGFWKLVRERGIRMLEASASEFEASNGLSLNVLPTAPNEVIMVAGFPETQKLMEDAGCRVQTFEADALCIACEGGPTCLTRPFLRG
ncbi:MAG: amidinotransferase [Mesorhizobium amorphae]|nr:MAG: amidinotransferase [Mesorhizobium amorphae]